MKKAIIWGVVVATMLTVAAVAGYFVRDRNLVDRVITRANAELNANAAVRNGYVDVAPSYHDTKFSKLAVFEIPLDLPGRNYFLGGALEQVGSFVLFADRQGNIGTYDLTTNALTYNIATVPMEWDLGKSSVFSAAPNFNTDRLRVTDLLVLDTAENGQSMRMLVSHHRFHSTCIEFLISHVALTVDQDAVTIDADSWDVFFETNICLEPLDGNQAFEGHQSGGRMVHYGPDHILLTTGDYEFDGVSRPERVSLNPDSDMGKLFQINLKTLEYEIIADGLRNPQGLTVSADGTIFETEHGPDGGDEVNIIRPNASYGWPEVTLGRAYGDLEAWPTNPAQGRHEGFTKPLYSFLPSIGISNLVIAPADTYPLWENDLLVSSLNGQTIYRLRLDGERIVYQEAILKPGMRIRDIIVLKNGMLVALGDFGRLFLIRQVYDVTATERDKSPFEAIRVTGYDQLPEMINVAKAQIDFPKTTKDAGLAAFNQLCSACHRLNGESHIGPPLNGVVGRDIASAESFSYSQALISLEGNWLKDQLVSYILNPNAIAEGTNMSGVDIDRSSAQSIVEYLATFD